VSGNVVTSTGDIPVEVADISAAWLQEVLQPHAPGATLRGIEVAEAHSGTTGRARVRLVHDDPRLPAAVFVKLAPFDEGQRQFVEQQGMGRAEARFYAELAGEVPVRVPRPWHAAHDDAGRYVMVLEDLQAIGARYPGASDPHLAAFVEGTIDAFAAVHAAYWASPRFAAGRDLAWVERRSRGYGSAAPLVTFAVEQLGDALPEASRRLAAVYLPRADGVATLLAEGPPTLIHGDAHIGNMFAVGDSPGFLDWAMVSAAPGVRDVAYFLGGSVGTELREKRERDLVVRYCQRLAARGVALDADAAWEQYRLHLLTAWIAAVVTAAMGSHWQPIEIGLAATRRANAAIEQHDVASLLRARLP
jgi:aminoglycoside phosphotransferase (APT) family kinase protein